MSRSFKKNPYCGDRKGKQKKRLANKRVREYLKNCYDTFNGRSYRKICQSWNICDYYSKDSFAQFKAFINTYNSYYWQKTEEELYQDWLRAYKRK